MGGAGVGRSERVSRRLNADRVAERAECRYPEPPLSGNSAGRVADRIQPRLKPPVAKGLRAVGLDADAEGPTRLG